MYAILQNFLCNDVVSWGVYNTKILSWAKTEILAKSAAK